APELLSLPGHQLYLRKTRTNFNKARLASINAIFKPIDSLEIKPLILFNYDRNRFFKHQAERTNAAGSQFINETDYNLNKRKRFGFGKLEINFDISKNQRIESTTKYNNGKFHDASQLIFNEKVLKEELPRNKDHLSQT